MTKTLFIEFIGDIADAVQRADSEEFRIECVGILGNLNIPDLDFERFLMIKFIIYPQSLPLQP